MNPPPPPPPPQPQSPPQSQPQPQPESQPQPRPESQPRPSHARSAAGARRAVSPTGAFAGLWLLAAVVGALLPLTADEAYYLAWSQRPALGYLDHPPAIAWLLWCSGGHPRLAAWLGAGAVALGLGATARRLGAPAWRWVPAAALATPLGFGLSLFATPDLPLMLAWTGVLWAFAAGRPWLAGLALGACLWSKATVLVALPGVALAFGAQAPRVLAVAGLVSAPLWHWSATHGGDPFALQWGRLFGLAEVGAPGRSGFFLPEALGAQALVLTPWLLWAAITRWRRPGGPVERRLGWLSWPGFVAWMAAACLTRVEANWTALALPGVLLSLALRPMMIKSKRKLETHFFKYGLRWSVALTALVAAALPVLSAWAPERGPPRDPARLAACVAALAGPGEAGGTETSGAPDAAVRPAGLPVVAARYQERALLAAAGVAVGYRRAVGHRLSQYDRWDEPDPPRCGFVYLGDRAALGACPGPVETVRACGRTATRCACARTVRRG